MLPERNWRDRRRPYHSYPREVAWRRQMAAREMKKQDTEQKAVHEMTAVERAATERHFARCEATPSIRCKVSRNGSDLQIELDHPDE